MLQSPPVGSSIELDAAILQTALTLGLAAYGAFLHRRYRKPYFFWFAVTWLLYVMRLGAIMAFVVSEERYWLYWHQVVTGWTALALLWAALVFSRQLRFRPAYLAVLLFPLAWSYVAIYQLDNFLFAALPAVLFLSVVTAGTGAVFFQHWRRVRAPGAAFLAGALFLWAIHHLDYPFLRAQGAWAPWGYYLDIVLLLAVAIGLTTLVLDELRQGFSALTSLAGAAAGVAAGHAGENELDDLLERALTLPATRGAALFSRAEGAVVFSRGVGDCAAWEGRALPPGGLELVAEAIASGRPSVQAGWPAGEPDGERAYPYAVALPIPRVTAATAALVLVGDARNPFSALDDTFLVALGQQVASALDGAELTRRLRARTSDLTRLSARMIEQHEEERRRLSLELHDETAQVFSAVKLQLGVLRERAAGDLADGLGRAERLVDAGMQSIRNVTETLRPTALDDLGLVPALRSLAGDFAGKCGIAVELEAPDVPPDLSPEAELALFRALQEALANVARHSDASRVRVELAERDDGVALTISDDGVGGVESPDLARLEREGHMGLAGMRERLLALGGSLHVARAAEGGTRLELHLPPRAGAAT